MVLSYFSNFKIGPCPYLLTEGAQLQLASKIDAAEESNPRRRDRQHEHATKFNLVHVVRCRIALVIRPWLSRAQV